MQTDAPNPEPAETKAALACYMDQQRICGPDCMAYLPQVPDGAAYQGENWAHCLLLVNAERSGKHLIILADLLKKAQAGALRTQKPPGV